MVVPVSALLSCIVAAKVIAGVQCTAFTSVALKAFAQCTCELYSDILSTNIVSLIFKPFYVSMAGKVCNFSVD